MSGASAARRRRGAAAFASALLMLVTAAAAAAAPKTAPNGDPFYRYAGSLSKVAPGTVLRQRPVSLAELGGTAPFMATQVLYRTTGERGQPTVTVATVVRALTQPIVTRILSYQTAYDALGSQCDPSYTLQGGSGGDGTAAAEEQVILAYVAQGDTVVVPDYEGEQLDWGAGQESGYGTLDGIRAAESLLHVPARSTPVAMFGYSGGSIATEFASELAPSYSPQLDIVGTAEGGLPVDFLHNLDYVNGSPSWSGVIPAVFVSVSRAFGVRFSQFLSPYGKAVTNKVKDECINSFVGKYPGLKIEMLLRHPFDNVLKMPAIVEVTNHLIMGRSGTPRGPLLIGVGNSDGTGDGIMVSRDVEALAHEYCRRGVPVQFHQYNGDDHGNAAIAFEIAAGAFILDRLSGLAVPNGCGSIGTGNSLAPYPVPSTTPGLSVTDTGVDAARRGLVVVLRTAVGTWTGLRVTLERNGRAVARSRSFSFSHRRELVLRQRLHAPPPGRYVLRVGQGFVTLFERTIRIR